MISTATPLRVSFAGGGTDLPDYFLNHGGQVVSSAIDRFVYVTIFRREEGLFNERYRLSYFESEVVQSVEEIRNETARECLRLVPVEGPLHISTSSDVPASSGLGSSSSFAVGLLLALHAMRGESVSAGQLAEEACEIEIGILNRPIGKQDQFAAAFGGLNAFRFETTDLVAVRPIWRSDGGVEDLFDCLSLVWTGVQRESHTVLTEQQKSIPTNLELLGEIRSQSDACVRVLLEGNDLPAEVGGLLSDGWNLKKKLASNVSGSIIDKMCESVLKAGAYGAKICGAGAGGFLMVVYPQSAISDISRALSPATQIRVRPEPRGSRIIAVL